MQNKMDRQRCFMISVDTEGDDQWDNQHEITTENAAFLPRFQELCEAHGLKPVWLTTYEMAQDPALVDFLADRQERGRCEVGMHLHAWSTPPEAPLARSTPAREFLIEYPEEVMEAKIRTMTECLTARFGVRPVSHRSGRWIMDERYFRLLRRFDYLVDCSVTPLVSWEKTQGATGRGGCDYRGESLLPYFRNDGILEIPVTIRRLRFLDRARIRSLHSALRELRNLATGVAQWLRPFDVYSEQGMLTLLNNLERSEPDSDLLFTLHSSELMPGGSPSFPDEASIEALYREMEQVFSRAERAGYRGVTMREYYSMKQRERESHVQGR
ncbi:deacetylase [Lachnoclostridium sp. Marseille-P6806]|uniref:deacetylase n=1 Tax=Lachnoclostridium sp. Marseille-P6806 TaxID=2364793 RepID=UPI001031B1A9|nr:deacetylase [Lachnoclostridium sp. Marseille-P6806]